jgi:hypothetical protein
MKVRQRGDADEPCISGLSGGEVVSSRMEGGEMQLGIFLMSRWEVSDPGDLATDLCYGKRMKGELSK